MIFLLTQIILACPTNAVCRDVSVPLVNGSASLKVQQWSYTEEDNIPIYFIAGGPGQSGVALAPYIAPLFARSKRDIIFYEPLGMNEDTEFSCSKASSLEEIFSQQKTTTQCVFSKDFSPVDYTSIQSAHHIEAIRRANGHEKIIVLGSSYGTRIAQLYAQEYPSAVSAMILDGALPIGEYIGNSKTAEEVLNLVLKDEGMTMLQSILVSLLHPIEIPNPFIEKTKSNLFIQRESFLLALHGALYRTSDQHALRNTLREIQEDNWVPFLSGVYKRIQEPYAPGLYLSVFCAEDWRMMCAENDSFFPFCQSITAECTNWPHVEMRYRKTKSIIPTLILQGSRDPVSSLQFAKDVKEQFPNGYMIAFLEEGHGVSMTTCGRAIVLSFLNRKKEEDLRIRPSCQSKIRIHSSDE